MNSHIKHLVFVDDDQDAVRKFTELYARDPFTITTIHAPEARHALSRIKDALKGSKPDLFVLDLYFPHGNAREQTFARYPLEEMTAPISKIIAAAKRVEDSLIQDRSEARKIIGQLYAVVHQSQQVLQNWCKRIDQSPQGGMVLLHEINKEYPATPKVFYSVYVTLADAKEAFAAGVIDMLSKPDSSNESEERKQADKISELFLRYSKGEPPTFLQRLAKRFGLEIGFDTTQGIFIKLTKKTDSA